MFYTGTRSHYQINSADAITRGIAPDGGLFVPVDFPAISEKDFEKLINADYKTRAKLILSLFLTDYSAEELDKCVEGAYTGNFDNNDPAPLHILKNGLNILELWHGPTCAFKDMALQLLPFLLQTGVAKTAPGRTVVILVATSGDTGKAALAGFADVPGTEIIVFYPQNGVSAMQKRQMTTQTGKNVAVCAINGNFDHAQSGVKAVFANNEIKDFLHQHNAEFSSANSINFGRLVPQLVYYVSSYCDLVKRGIIKKGEEVNVAVPTGNFGNILAAYYAKRIGIPFKKFICASNSNDVLTEFINTGVYNRMRDFHTTISPSMDILISSNLERLLYHLTDGNCAQVKQWMEELKNNGSYKVDAQTKQKIQQLFAAGCCNDAETLDCIGQLFKEEKYLCDTHTAVAVKVTQEYQRQTCDKTPVILASTASPYKFARAVLPAISDEKLPDDDFALLEQLSRISNTEIPRPLAQLKTAEIRHKDCIEKEDMADFIRRTAERLMK